MLIIAFILLAVAWIIMTILYFSQKKATKRQYVNSQFWFMKFDEAQENYNALETGRDEESESYEQLYISYEEKIKSLSSENSTLLDDRQMLFVVAMWHEMHCLPDLELMQINGIINVEDWENLKLRMGVPVG